MQQLTNMLDKLANAPESIEFPEVMACVEQCYHYTPCAFSCGEAISAAGSNEGSCKILAFAKLHELSERQTLALFGQYYRDDVLGNPDGDDHSNIRNFMQYGWDGVSFEGQPLTLL